MRKFMLILAVAIFCLVWTSDAFAISEPYAVAGLFKARMGPPPLEEEEGEGASFLVEPCAGLAIDLWDIMKNEDGEAVMKLSTMLFTGATLGEEKNATFVDIAIALGLSNFSLGIGCDLFYKTEGEVTGVFGEYIPWNTFAVFSLNLELPW